MNPIFPRSHAPGSSARPQHPRPALGTATPPLPRTEIRVQVHFPTTDLVGARGLLRTVRSNEEVMDLIMDSLHPDHISWAWNIARKDSGRSTVRILVAALEAIQAGRRFEADTEQVARLMAGDLVQEGKAPAFIHGKDFARMFLCKPEHVSRLLREQSIGRLPNTGWRRGPGGSARIGWEQFKAFLAERKL